MAEECLGGYQQSSIQDFSSYTYCSCEMGQRQVLLCEEDYDSVIIQVREFCRVSHVIIFSIIVMYSKVWDPLTFMGRLILVVDYNIFVTVDAIYQIRILSNPHI